MFAALRLQNRRRVPVILQLSSLECGVACLTMALNYFGRPITLMQCRESFDIGRDGATALNIAEAARRLGLRVRAYSLEPEDFQHVNLPAIVHWEFNHFIVVERWDPTWVDIVDV